MAFYNRKKSNASKEADRAYAMMNKTVKIGRYAGNVSYSVGVAAKNAFLDLNPTIKEINNITGSGIKNVRSKYLERMEARNIDRANKGLQKTSKLSLKELVLAASDAYKESQKGDSLDVDELKSEGITLDPSKFAMEAKEGKLFEDGDQIMMNTKNVIIRSKSESVATLSNSILTAATSIVRVNQEGFQSMLTGLGEIAGTNVQFYNDMNNVLVKLNEQMSALNRLSKIDTVSGMSTNSAISELVMGNFTMANMMKAFKDAKKGSSTSSTGNKTGDLIGLALGSSFLSNKLKGTKLKSKISKLRNMKNNTALSIYDYLDSNSMGRTSLAGRIQGLRDKKGVVGRVARKIIPKNFKESDGALDKGSKFLKKMLFGDIDLNDKGEPDISNKLDKGTAVSFDAETHNTINTVIPGYLGKILAHFTKQPEIVYDYSSGKWISVSDARKMYRDKISDAVKGNDMVETFGKRLFGENNEIPEGYNDLMTELGRNRDLKPEDIKKLSGKYGEAAYKLYESIFSNEEMMKDFKTARNSASREIYTVNNSKEFSGSMLNAFNDKIDLVNDSQVEASQLRTKIIRDINKAVSSTNATLGGKPDGEEKDESSSPSDKSTLGEASDIISKIKGTGSRLFGSIKEKGNRLKGFLDSKLGRILGKDKEYKLKGWFDGFRGKVLGGKDKIRNKFVDSFYNLKDKINKRKHADIGKAFKGKRSFAKKVLELPNSDLGKKLLEFGGGSGPGGGTNGIIDGNLTLPYTNILMKLLGNKDSVEPSGNELQKTSDDHFSEFTEVLDKIGGSKVLSNAKLNKMFKKSPAARSVMKFVKNINEKGWFDKAKTLQEKTGPLSKDSGDIVTLIKEIASGNLSGGLMSFGMGKLSGKISGKFTNNTFMQSMLKMASKSVGNSIGKYINPFKAKEALAADEGPTENPMSGRNVLSGHEENEALNSVAQVGSLAQQAAASGASLSTINNVSNKDNPITQSTVKSTPLNSNPNSLASEFMNKAQGNTEGSSFGAGTYGRMYVGGKGNSELTKGFGEQDSKKVVDTFKAGFSGILGPSGSNSSGSTATSGNGFSEKMNAEANLGNNNENQIDTGSLTSPVHGTLGSLINLNNSMNDVIKKNAIIADMQKNPTTMAKKLLAFTPLGAAFHMMDNGFDPINPSSAITASIDNYFEDLSDAMDEFIELAEQAAAGGGGGDGSDGGGGSISGGNVSAGDIDSFLKASINNNFGCDYEKMYKEVAGFTKVKHYFGGNIEQIKKATQRIKSNGVSPEFFWAYEGQEQGLGHGWLNHYPSMGDPWTGLDQACEWVKSTSRTKHGLAWYDAGHPGYVTPKEKQAAGQKKYDSLPMGSIGRVYLTGTAAATWAAFDPDALKASVNGVQNYGDPIKGCISTLKRWGSGSGSSKASVSDGDSSSSNSEGAAAGGVASALANSSGDSSSSSSGGDSGGGEAPERSASLAKWDDDMQNKVIERIAKKYQLMYDKLNGKEEKAAESTAKSAANKIDDTTKGIGKPSSSDSSSGGSSSSGSSASTPGGSGNISYIDENGNIIINGGDPESLAVAKNKLKVQNDILDILRKILKATKDISGYTKQALEKLVKMIKEIETQTDLTEENNEVSEITNELLKRLNISGGGVNSIGLSNNPNEFELPNDILIPVYRGY